jgi:putative endonuclease
MWFVYILLCVDKSLYTGTTNNVEARFALHLAGKGAKYTRSHKPVKIVYQEKLVSKSAALKREMEIKSWSKTKKLSLISI